MKNSKRICKIGVQGDVLFRRVEILPEGAEASPQSDKYVVAHSETGHHHIATGAAAHYTLATDPLVAYLAGPDPIQVKHHREWDRHDPCELYAPGDGGEVIWEVRRQVETMPDGMTRMVID